jgi:opacity protein-like surface antigen
MDRFVTALVMAAMLAPPAGAADAADATRAELSRERRRLAADTTRLSDTSRRLETALSTLASASRAFAEGTARADSGGDELSRREEAVAEAEQDVRSLLEKRRLLADRILDRKRSIGMLEAELGAKKPADTITGRWAVTVEPGEQRGAFRMTLDGTLVSGDYTLEGGYSGSLRGTLINDRLRLERVDSKLGFTAVYVGRMARDGATIGGTWESTNFGTGGPGSGRWQAVREEEKEEPK